MKRLVLHTLILSCIGLTAPSASAVVIAGELNPSNSSQNAGLTSRTFTQSGYSLTARGYDYIQNGSPGLNTTSAGAGLVFDDKFVAVPDFGSFHFLSVAAANGRALPGAFQANITPVPEMSSLFPIIGLFAAVSSTHVLRRRRAARLAADQS